LGFEVLPPEEFVNILGWSALNFNRATNTAIEWLASNVANHPDSPNAHASLAEAYEIQGEKQLAIQHYELSLKRWPGNRDAARRLRRLKPFSGNDGGPLGNGVYQVVNQASGLALQVAGGSTEDGARVDQSRYTGALHQQWRFLNQGDGYYLVTAAHSDKALDVHALSTHNGARVIQWTTNGGANQIWRAQSNGDGTFRLLNDQSGHALQAANDGKSHDAALVQWEWEARDNQKWRVQSVSPRRQ
jgi:hypothetical protein